MKSIDPNLKGKELYDFLVANKSLLIAEKKYNIKHSDAFRLSNYSIDSAEHVVKGMAPVSEDGDTITVTSVINSCNWFDSHKDVHIPGIWKKSLSENKSLYLLQEHSMTFKGIISDEVQASTKKVSWKDLGYDAIGETEVLIFVSKISKSRNEFMFNEYRMKRVKNHSIGMRYVQIEMAINDEDYKEEFAVWNKYLPQIANKETVENEGFFFAVKEAKVAEGSAVPIGSNIITPTLEIKTDTTIEPSPDTQEEPSHKSSFDIKQLLNIF